jgi:hypothetical protein
MEFKKRSRPRASAPAPSEAPVVKSREASGGGAGTPPPADTITVQHGIHTDNYPVVGLTVREVRERLAPVMNIDPESVAVVAGNPVVDEGDHVLSSSDQILSFVKKSAVKGGGGHAGAPGTGGRRGR